MGAIESLFSRALRVESPWEVEKVEFVESLGRINVVLDFPRGSLFPCPRCQKATTAYDTTQKQWWHMNFFRYASREQDVLRGQRCLFLGSWR